MRSLRRERRRSATRRFATFSTGGWDAALRFVVARRGRRKVHGDGEAGGDTGDSFASSPGRVEGARSKIESCCVVVMAALDGGVVET
jgi:hypothetical protein